MSNGNLVKARKDSQFRNWLKKFNYHIEMMNHDSESGHYEQPPLDDFFDEATKWYDRLNDKQKNDYKKLRDFTHNPITLTSKKHIEKMKEVDKQLELKLLLKLFEPVTARLKMMEKSISSIKQLARFGDKNIAPQIVKAIDKLHENYNELIDDILKEYNNMDITHEKRVSSLKEDIALLKKKNTEQEKENNELEVLINNQKTELIQWCGKTKRYGDTFIWRDDNTGSKHMIPYSKEFLKYRSEIDEYFDGYDGDGKLVLSFPTENKEEAIPEPLFESMKDRLSDGDAKKLLDKILKEEPEVKKKAKTEPTRNKNEGWTQGKLIQLPKDIDEALDKISDIYIKNENWRAVTDEMKSIAYYFLKNRDKRISTGEIQSNCKATEKTTIGHLKRFTEFGIIRQWSRGIFEMPTDVE